MELSVLVVWSTHLNSGTVQKASCEVSQAKMKSFLGSTTHIAHSLQKTKWELVQAKVGSEKRSCEYLGSLLSVYTVIKTNVGERTVLSTMDNT